MSANRVLLIISLGLLAGTAFAQEKTDPCTNGMPWILPPSKPKDLGEQHVVRNTAAPVRVTVCNCTGKRQADSYVILNAYRAEGTKVRGETQKKQRSMERSDLPNSNTFTRVYAGACVDAGGTDVLIRNPSENTNANGTYLIAK
jgi:hypothetical protein